MVTKRKQHRRGTLYIAVMGVGLIVSVIALTASSMGRIESRAARASHNQREAQLLAASAIEQALVWMNRNPDWRQTMTSGVETTPAVLGNGNFTWSVTDTDGDLDDDPRDHAVLQGMGRVGGAIAVEEARIEPAGRALTCLEAVAHAKENLEIDSGATLAGIGFLSSSGDIQADSATVDLDSEATGDVEGDTYNGAIASGVPLREMPGEHVFDYYLARGTPIGISDLPKNGSTHELKGLVLGPNHNPFGEPNPWGIYVIDCQEEPIRISRIRLSGTLYLFNLGGDSEVRAPVMLDPLSPNQPTLLVDGDISIGTAYQFFMITVRNLSEIIYGVNYNPVGLPYNGESDDSTDDSYPSKITGGVYATGTVTIQQDCDYEGFVVANEIKVESNQEVDATYRPYALNYPPIGFSAGQGVRLIPGSRRRVAY